MLYLFTGTDREKARVAMRVALERMQKKSGAKILRITDAHTPEDLREALQGRGMFGDAHIVVLEGILASETMGDMFFTALPTLAQSKEQVFLYEEKLDAATRRRIEKHAQTSEKYDAEKKERDNSIFILANALRRGDRKALWVEYQRALAKGERVESVHGILFWGAKKMFLSARQGSAEHRRAERLVAELAELPHDARRKSFELEYALEKYLLDVNKA